METIKDVEEDIEVCECAELTHMYLDGQLKALKDVLEFIDDEFYKLPVRYNFIRLILKKRIKGE